MLIRYNHKDKEPSPQTASTPLWKSLKELFSYKVIVLFLIAYLFYSDALLTFSNNFPLYLEKVHHLVDTSKSLLTIIILVV